RLQARSSRTTTCSLRSPAAQTIHDMMTPPTGSEGRSLRRLDVVRAIVRRAGDLHHLEIVGILDVLLRDLALVSHAVALPHHHLAEPFELGAEPAAHHEDQMKSGVVGVPRGAAARLA